MPLAGSPYPVWKIPFPAKAACVKRDFARRKRRTVPSDLLKDPQNGMRARVIEVPQGKAGRWVADGGRIEEARIVCQSKMV
jgi:hypothetical protein